MSNQGFGHLPVAANDAEMLKEPLPWMSRVRAGGTFRLPGLRHPLACLVYGLVLLMVGAAALLVSLGAGGAALAAGISVGVIAGAAGVVLLVVAAVRWSWYRQFVAAHGYPPF